MTKNFEEEYKKYAVNSVPDLWGRIEAAIDEKESIKEDTEVTGTISSSKVISISEKRTRHINPAYFTAIAAAACLFLAIGAIRFIGGANKSSESAAAPAAMTENYDSAAAEEAAPAADEAPVADQAQTANETQAEDADAVYEATAEEAYEAEEAPAAAPATNGAELPDMEEAAEADESMLSAKQQYKAGERKAIQSEVSEAPMAYTKEEDDNIELVCHIEDISALENEDIFMIKVSDPLESDIKKNDVITVKINEKDKDSLSEILLDSRSNEITIKIKAEEDGSYTFISAEIKK